MNGKVFGISFLVLLITAVMVGCAAPLNKNFPMIEQGMSISEVESLIGKPISAESGPENTKILYYRLASSFLDTDGSDTREYYVAIRSDEVVGYGERIDAVTTERADRQYNSAWNAARSAASSSTQATSETNVNVNTLPTVQIYTLAGRSYDGVRGMTVCTYRQAVGKDTGSRNSSATSRVLARISDLRTTASGR